MLLLKNNEEKQKAARVLKNLGNNRHNAEVIWKGKGELIVARAPSDDSEWDSRAYAPCDLCFGWFKEDELYRHICPCKAPGVRPSLKAGKAIRNMMEQNVSEGMATVLVGLHEDDIGKAAKSDDLLLHWLELKAASGFWHHKKWQSQTRAKMRLGGRLLLECRKKWPGATLNDLIKVDKFDDCVAATKACALSSGNLAAETPLKLGHLISALIKRKHLLAIKTKDADTMEEMKELRELWEGEWGERVTVPCHFALKERRRNEVPCIPTTEDTVRFADLLKKKLMEATREFEQSKTYQNYRKLQEVLLTRMVQFNRKRGGDVSEATLEDYQKAKEMNLSTSGEIFRSMTEEEQASARLHELLVLNGKKNKNNNCLLDLPMQTALDLLVKFRNVADFHPENHFLFAIQNSKNSFLNHTKIRAKFVEEAGVTHMAARGMRKYVVTTHQVSSVLIYVL
jgi:hypothetical protein